MLYDEYNLFESVIHITEERDKRSLEKSLVKTLSGFIDFDALILLRMPRSKGGDYLEAAVSYPDLAYEDKLKLIPYAYGDPRVELDDSLTSCIESCEPVSEDIKGVRRTLFPISVNNVVIGVLDTYGYQEREDTKKLIDGDRKSVV